MSKTTSKRNRLRVLRAEADLTQYETAQKARLSRNRYWRIEQGWTDPTEAEIARIARVFKVDPGIAFPDPTPTAAVQP